MNFYESNTANSEENRIAQKKQKEDPESLQRSMLNSLQQMYYGIRNSQSSRETYSQAMLPPQAQQHRDASSGQPRPLQQTYSRYIDQSQQENFNHVNMPQNAKNRVRFDANAHHPSNKFVVSRNPASKSQNVSLQHTRTHTDLHKEYSQEKAPKMGRRPKQDKNPTLGSHHPFVRGSDSPPSVSLTASPEKTTEKKLINLHAANKQKLAEKKDEILPFQCLECAKSCRRCSCREPCFLAYKSNPNYGNCSSCGAFHDRTAYAQALRAGSSADQQTMREYLIFGVRTRDQKFKAEVPMDNILDGLVECQSLGKRYNPRAFYVRTREFFIDWMGNLCGELQHHTETFHHSVNVFDAYLQMPNIKQHIVNTRYFREKTDNQIMTLIAAACIFISAKYHEMTYPGVQQLLEYIRVPFTYDEFVAQEADILNSLDWRVQYISTYDILTHFYCQGIILSTDQIKNQTTQQLVPVDFERQPSIIRYNAEVLLERCLKMHEFLEYERLTLACGILMAARKVSNLADLWPEQLVAMSGNRLRYPQVKLCMRHVLSYFPDVSCSITNSVTSSPAKDSPATVQKTVKRQPQIVMISNHKRHRKIEGDNKSQEQTTSKKTASSSIIAMQRAAMGGRENSPANGQIPVNALASILKRSQEKNAMQVAQQNASNVSQQKRGSNASLNQTQNRIQKSITSKDLSSSKKANEVSAASRAAEARADSQPAKQTHSLQKQDSSKYLRGEGQKVSSQQEHGEKRIANRANRQQSTSGVNQQSKPNSNSKVIYKVRNAICAVSGPLFAVRPNFGHCTSPSERLKTLETPSEVNASVVFNLSGHLEEPIRAQIKNSALTKSLKFAQIAKTSAPRRDSSKNQQVASHHGDASLNRIDTQGSSQKKSLSSYLNLGNSSAQQVQLDSQKKASAYHSVNSTHNVANPQTANKLSGAKSNASESTTLKKVVPAHMVKPVARHQSQDAHNSHGASQISTNQKLMQRIRSSKVEKSNTSAQLNSVTASNSGNKSAYPGAQQSAAPRSHSQNLGQSTADTVKASESQMPTFMANIQKRSLQKQFESIEMKVGGDNDNKNFVVQSMTTANQRASSKSSSGSTASFIQKLTTTQKAGVQIAHHQSANSGSTAAASAALHSSAQAAMTQFKRDSSYMTAKQAELHSMRIRSQEGRHAPSSFQEQHKMNNPEDDPLSNTKHCSEFTLGSVKQPQFQRIKATDAAHEISQVMLAAAKTSRDVSGNKHPIQAPKVIAGPQIIGKGNSKIDISHVQAYLHNLKLQNAAAAASHSQSSQGLKISHQSTAGSSGSGTTIPNLSGIMNTQVYARSTSRGKEHAHYNQALKLSAMLGKQSNFNQPISVRTAINQTQIGHSLNPQMTHGSSAHGKAPNFHPRPSSIRMKMGSDPKDLPTATVIQASQRHHSNPGIYPHPRAAI